MRLTTRLAFVAILVLGAAGCGGGGSSTPATPPAGLTPTQSSAAPTVLTTVVVDVTDESGAPVVGATVNAFGLTQATDARGIAEFAPRDVAVRERWASVSPPSDDFYEAYQNTVQPQAGRTALSFRLLRRRTVAVLGARTVNRSPAGDRLTAEVDVSVFAGDGRREEPPPGAFGVGSVDCGWGPSDCATGPDGRSVRIGGAAGNFETRRGTITVISLPGGSAAPVVAGMLVDVGARAATRDPTGRRFTALRTYFAVAAGASVAVATIGAGPSTAVPATGFGVDGARFDSVLTSLARTSGVASVEAPVYPAVAEMATAAGAAAAAADARRHVVALVARSFWGSEEDTCASTSGCRWSLDATIAAVRVHGVRVIAVGGSDQLADLAVRTGGVYVDVSRSVQWDAAARALPALLDGTAPRQRVTFELEAPAGTFVAGGTVYAVLSVVLAPGQTEEARFAVPIPAP